MRRLTRSERRAIKATYFASASTALRNGKTYGDAHDTATDAVKRKFKSIPWPLLLELLKILLPILIAMFAK